MIISLNREWRTAEALILLWNNGKALKSGKRDIFIGNIDLELMMRRPWLIRAQGVLDMNLRIHHLDLYVHSLKENN